MIGDDYSNVPPAQALANRGIIHNLRGYSIYRDYSKPQPPAALIEAVAAGEIDVAIAWGPLAGFSPARQQVPLNVTPVSPQMDPPSLRFVFDIAMGVRREDTPLRDALDGVIRQRRAEIERISGASACRSSRRQPHDAHSAVQGSGRRSAGACGRCV